MSETFLCVMAELDDASQLRLRRIYERLSAEGLKGRQSKSLPYHVTLGIFPPTAEKDLLDLLASTSMEFHAFPLAYNSIGLFRMDVLFAAPNPNRELLALHRHFGGTEDARGWTPHTTLLIDQPANLQQAIPLVAGDFETFTARVSSISLYQFQPTRFIQRATLE